MKKILLLILVCVSALSFSQPATKLDFYLAQKLDAYTNKRESANTMLPMLIKGNIVKIKQLVQSNKGVFKYSAGNIAAIVIPLSALETFNESGFVTRMEGGPHHMHCMDDSSNAKMHITEVLNGQSPLPQAYNGKGVVVGFVDSGIDYLHEDFRDSSGTRVKYYWDMNRYVNGYTPSPYGYGQSWTKAQIDASSGVDPNDSASILVSGHGSNVAGAGVGNGRCNGHEFGAAPKADIIYVAYNFSNQTATMMTDAVQYIYECADSLNEPCVINISVGDYEGSHDDSDLQGEMIDNMILAKQPGRVLVASAGNDGYPYHLRDSMSAGDTNFTWFKYDAGIGIADIPIFSNKGDFTNVKFRLRCDKVQTGSYSERDVLTSYSTIASYMGLHYFIVYNASGDTLAQVQSYGQVYGTNSYSLEFQILPDSTSYYWGFQTIGPGKYDAWNLGSIIGVVDSVGLDINPSTYPWMKHYTQPDSTETICSSYQCSPNVITAVTYWNRKTYIDCNGNLETNSNLADHPGAYVYDSKGPTRNHVHMKPDVAAAGQYTLAAIPTWFTGCNGATDSNACHMIDGGTSMAAPMVSGSVALYLERYPNANNHDVWICFTSTAAADAFTGPPSQLPNYNWGYGKLDADSALISCGPTSTGVVHSINNCMLAAFPNPYSESTTITYDFSTITNYSKASIIVYNVIGKEVRAIELKSNSGNVTLDRATLASGMYFYSLMVDGTRLRTEKLEVL